ncbi:MAG: dTDP-4-dehydrorhamnose reductase [Chloroflexota bacterium]
MRILITGGRGRLGRALQDTLTSHELTMTDQAELDITNRAAVLVAVHEAQAELVIHCAAYTDVDGCARDPDLAHRVNALGTQNVALACQAAGAAMLHVSTNEVFAGDNPAGYEEWMPRNPINPYGRSKAAAEWYVQSLLHRYYVVRPAWLYGPGGRNFIHAILNRARTAGEVRVVVDEVGNPTYSHDLAEAIGRLIVTGQYGVYHLVNEGSCSRWAFANEILRLAGLTEVRNLPILSRDYPRASTPPPYAALRNVAGAALGITLRPWTEALADYLKSDA